MAKSSKKKSSNKKEKKNVPHGIVSIFSSFNNTIISLSDLRGNVFAWSSTGKHNFKGSRKSTPFAAKIVGEDIVELANLHGMKSCDIQVKGPGSGRESALRAVASSSIKITSIRDVTPIPHNGCRPPKRRRI